VAEFDVADSELGLRYPGVFYAVKKASEMVARAAGPFEFAVEWPIHCRTRRRGWTAHARVYSLEEQAAGGARREEGCADRDNRVFHAGPGAIFLKENVALVKLELRDSSGKLMSDNFYWMGETSADYRKLNRLGEAQIRRW